MLLSMNNTIDEHKHYGSEQSKCVESLNHANTGMYVCSTEKDVNVACNLPAQI